MDLAEVFLSSENWVRPSSATHLLVSYYFKVTTATCCSSLHHYLTRYYPFRSKPANAYPKPHIPGEESTLREHLLKWTKELSYQKLLKAVFDLSSQIPGDPQLLLRILESQLWKESPLAWIQVCLCESSHYYREFLQDPQILFESHRFKTYPPVNKSFTVKHSQEVSQYLFSQLVQFLWTQISCHSTCQKGRHFDTIQSLQEVTADTHCRSNYGMQSTHSQLLSPPYTLCSQQKDKENPTWEKSKDKCNEETW